MDADYIAYREERIEKNRKKRMKIVRRQRIILAFAIIAIVFLSLFLALSLESKADSGDIRHKYYTSRTLYGGDSLYAIAMENYSDEYKDIDTYIDEVCSINHIADKNSIQAGRSIIVPYYSYEFK